MYCFVDHSILNEGLHRTCVCILALKSHRINLRKSWKMRRMEIGLTIYSEPLQSLGAYYGSHLQTHCSKVPKSETNGITPYRLCRPSQFCYPLSGRYMFPAAQRHPALREDPKSGIPTFSMTYRGMKHARAPQGRYFVNMILLANIKWLYRSAAQALQGSSMRVYHSLYLQEGESLSLLLVLSITPLLQDSSYEVRVAFCAMTVMDPVIRLLLVWIKESICRRCTCHVQVHVMCVVGCFEQICKPQPTVGAFDIILRGLSLNLSAASRRSMSAIWRPVCSRASLFSCGTGLPAFFKSPIILINPPAFAPRALFFNAFAML